VPVATYRVGVHSEAVHSTFARLRRLKRAAERGSARMRFVLEGRESRAPLDPSRSRQYLREGCLLVPGLIPQDVIAEAVTGMWQGLGASPDDRDTWATLGPHPHLLKDARLLATYTDAVLEAAAQLVGEHVAGFSRPTHAFTINRVPREGDWRPNGAHLDYSLAELRHRALPLPFRIGAMTYLTDVPRHGGGTLIWPGSHVAVEALARSDRARYRYMSALSTDLHRLALGDGLELTPSRGDVLFLHPFCVHASSDNISPHPRLAINHKW